MVWRRSHPTWLLVRLVLFLVLALVSVWPVSGQEETVEVSRKKLERLEQILSEQLGSSTLLEMSMTERLLTLDEYERQINALRTESRILHGYVESFENRLNAMQLQLNRLREEHERALRSSIQFETQAIRIERSKNVWQTVALGAVAATAASFISDSPWAPVLAFAATVGVTIGIRSVASGEG